MLLGKTNKTELEHSAKVFDFLDKYDLRTHYFYSCSDCMNVDKHYAINTYAIKIQF